MQLVVAHKGKKSWRCRVRGHEAHSSLTPHGVNAVQIACEIVTCITEQAGAFRDRGRRDDAYDVPYTTVHIGMIHGGTALNIVPRDCSFDFEIRHLPFDDPKAFFAEVRGYADTLPAGDARGRSRTPTSSSIALTSAAGFDTGRRQRDRGARPALQRRIRLRQGVVRHRGVAVPQREHSHRSSAAPATSRRRTSPTNGSALDQLARCEAFMRRLADRVCAS